MFYDIHNVNDLLINTIYYTLCFATIKNIVPSLEYIIFVMFEAFLFIGGNFCQKKEVEVEKGEIQQGEKVCETCILRDFPFPSYY